MKRIETEHKYIYKTVNCDKQMEMMGTDIEEQGRDGGVAGDVNHAQVVWQVALSGAHEEQPERRYVNEK